MTIAGVSPVGELVDVFVIYEDGTPAHMQVLAGTEPMLSRPGAFVSRAEYGERVRELREGTAARVAELEAADEAHHRADYDALRAAGVAEDSARRLSGYGGA
ncbi:NAD-glutamate dehydrogenase [Streptomyces sp. GC420]|uniref:NAD-glutamate dehydrogenase n=1 Tax=Streptomyces sp. GC420 TaxID=2697568 RepID=UPI0014150578|nr:NAD-glutamate dehydrogenase [Streptomyces sp. GC420]NBM15779.1 hypothetical protein [Streptomyces sp. GC420]